MKDFRILLYEYEYEDGVKDAAQMQLVTVYMRINTAVVLVMCLCNLCLLMVVVVFVREGCEYISLCAKWKVLFKSFCDIFSVCLCLCVFLYTSCRRAVVPSEFRNHPRPRPRRHSGF